jgi:hypothetical protein
MSLATWEISTREKGSISRIYTAPGKSACKLVNMVDNVKRTGMGEAHEHPVIKMMTAKMCTLC